MNLCRQFASQNPLRLCLLSSQCNLLLLLNVTYYYFLLSLFVMPFKILSDPPFMEQPVQKVPCRPQELLPAPPEAVEGATVEGVQAEGLRSSAQNCTLTGLCQAGWH